MPTVQLQNQLCKNKDDAQEQTKGTYILCGKA
jgi:hypothetical protein